MCDFEAGRPPSQVPVQELGRLLRLRFVRAPYFVDASRSLKFVVAVSDEAGEPLSTADVGQLGVSAEVVCVDSSCAEAASLTPLDGPFCKWSGAAAAPADHACKVRVRATRSDGTDLPALDVLSVVSAPTTASDGGPSFHVERIFSTPSGDVFVREEFGLAIGAHVWNAGVVLAQYLVVDAASSRPDALRGRTGLELGSGCGLSGIVAARLGANMVLSDRQDSQLALLRHNAALSGARIDSTMTLDWTRPPDAEPALNGLDLVLAADVLYCDEPSNRALLELLCRLASPRTEILVAYTMRNAEHGPPGSAAPHPFFRAAEGHFDVSCVAAVRNVTVVRLNAFRPT